MAVRVDLESSRVFCPDACDVFVGCEAAERLEPAGMIVGVDEQPEVLPKLVMMSSSRPVKAAA